MDVIPTLLAAAVVAAEAHFPTSLWMQPEFNREQPGSMWMMNGTR